MCFKSADFLSRKRLIMETEISETKNSEIFELKATIVALRDQMELLSHNSDAAVQKAVQKSADEIQQLKNTASSLRNELENLRFEKDADVQKAVQKSADEIKQLKKTTVKMRAEIEKRAQ